MQIFMSLAEKSEFYPESSGCIELCETEASPEQPDVTSWVG